MSPRTRVEMIRLLSAEYAYAKMALPMGEKGLVLKVDGEFSPHGSELNQALVQQGTAAHLGERIQITNVEFKGHNILFEVNGGPRKKTKWYQRIEVGGMGGMTPITPQDPNAQAVHGSSVLLTFDKFVPEMTLAEMKQILLPVFDFSLKSAAQAYSDMMPPKIRAALKNHEVLVGMNREMVLNSKGRPPHKVRERDGLVEYEEWIYGNPPADVEFVRFAGEEVVQLKIMKLDGGKIVRTTREVDPEPGAPAPTDAADATPDAAGQAGKTAAGQPSAAKAPTLRRPGEVKPAETQDPGYIYGPRLPRPGDASSGSGGPAYPAPGTPQDATTPPQPH